MDPSPFHHYEILKHDDDRPFELGRGAMGVTYKAFDTKLRCLVALKVISPDILGSPGARERFLREARAAARLRHPNVASVIYLCNDAEPWFYAMEFIEGETLSALVKRQGLLDAPLALRIALQVCEALVAAHREGIVHRDIKPSNLMLTGADDELLVKVIDFGLAKSLAADAEITLTEGILGTPLFASPEQLGGEQVDIRSDIYSLGVTLWYLLGGQAPFEGSIGQVINQHLNRPPPLETLAAQPAGVVSLLAAMLQKNPAARPQTPAELKQMLKACLQEVERSSSPVFAIAPAHLPDEESPTLPSGGAPGAGGDQPQNTSAFSEEQPSSGAEEFSASLRETAPIPVSVRNHGSTTLPETAAKTKRPLPLLRTLVMVGVLGAVAGTGYFLSHPPRSPTFKISTPAPIIPTPPPEFSRQEKLPATTPNFIVAAPRTPPTIPPAPVQELGELKARANSGDPEAVLQLAAFYLDRAQPGDAEEAVNLLEKSSDPRAMNLLGRYLAEGQGMAKDIARSRELFEKAHAAGNLDALHNLAVIYMNEDANPTVARRLLQKGAEAGNADCMYSYARCLWEGAGGEANRDEALGWFRKAAELGQKDAAQWLATPR